MGDNVIAGSGDIQAAKANSLRRSQRVCLSVEVEVFVYRGDEKGPCEQAKTLTVSAHGALILLNTRVVIGDLLSLRNLSTQNELACRVVDLTIGSAGVPEVGVEFLKPEKNFWHIAFPPTDWSPRGPESKIYGPQVVANITKANKE
jgi:hypothetical protein